MRPSSLATESGRSVLDLPVDGVSTLLDQWCAQGRELAFAIGRRDLAIRLLLDRESPSPLSLSSEDQPALRIERDPRPYRGTAGILVDVCQGYGADDYILVAGATQILLEPLSDLAIELAHQGGDVALLSHGDGTPGSLFLIRCGCLQGISDVGYIDLKEMALPEIARGHRVRVLSRECAVGLPVKTGRDYILALRRYHQNRQGLGPGLYRDPFAEDWSSAFSIIEEGAEVHPRARLFDSVILRGSRVEEHAVVVRSVVGPKARIRPGSTIVDRFLS